MQIIRERDDWGPDIFRASKDEVWALDELNKRTPEPWHWIKSPENVNFDLLCVQNLVDIPNPIALVVVEGTPLYSGRDDIWKQGYRFPSLWRMGLTIPKRKVDDYIMPWLKQNPRGQAYYLKCNNAHNEAFVINVLNFHDGKVVQIRDNATPERLRQHDLARKNLMMAIPPQLGMFGVPYVFEYIMHDIEKLLTGGISW